MDNLSIYIYFFVKLNNLIKLLKCKSFYPNSKNIVESDDFTPENLILLF